MNNKILLFGIVMLLFISSAYAFVDPRLPGNVECSEDEDDYIWADSDITFNYSGGEFWIDHEDLPNSGAVYTVHIVRYVTDSTAFSQPAVYTIRADGESVAALNMDKNGGGNVEVYDNSVWWQIGPSNDNVYYNWTMTHDRFPATDVVNFTSDREGNYSVRDMMPPNNDFPVDKTYITEGTVPGGTDAESVWIWDGTDCPPGPIPPPPTTDTLNLSAPLPSDASSFDIQDINFNLTYNGSYETDCSIYLNDTLEQTINNFPLGTDVEVDFNISFTDDGSYGFIIGCWDGLNDTNTTEHTLAIDSIDVGSIFPDFNITNEPTVNFNTTVTSTSNFTCDLMYEGVINKSAGYSSGTNVFAGFDTTFTTTHEDLTFRFDCANDFGSESSASYTMTIDLSDPTISTDFVNYGLFFKDNISAQFNLTDDIQLHSFNISIDNKLIFNITNLQRTTYQYNLSWDVENLSLGEHNISIIFTDGHTAKFLKDEYDWSNGLFNDYMKYEFVEGGYIKTELKESSVFDTWTTKRLSDRYTQTLVPSNPSDTLTFVEESDTEIFIVNKPGHYKGQWIIIGNHWKDYVLKDEPESKVSIKRINKYKVEVTVSGIKNKERLVFESIGDLNIVEVSYPFIAAGAEATFTNPILEFQTQTMTFRMNKTSDVNTSATLVYNATGKTVTSESFSTYDLYSSTFLTPSIATDQENVSFYWQYDYFAPGNTEVGNITGSQTVNGIGFDNCTTFNTVAVNMTVKNETSGLAITDNSSFIKGYFKAWKSSESDYVEFNLTWGGEVNANYGLCINPADATYTMDAQLEYGADGFTSKLYYFNGYSISNTTNFLDFFLTDGTTQVTLTVRDFDDSVVESAVIKVLSYDVATDTATTTEVVETDSNGEAFVQLILDTEWYVFIVEVDGVLKLQTIPTRITSTSKTLRIDLEDIKYFDRYDVTRGITHSLTWTNATQTFTFTWSDPSGDMVDGCLKVSRRSINSESILSNACTTSTASTITYTVTDNITNQMYIAVSYIKFADGEVYILKTLIQSFEDTYKKFGLTGIFVSFLLILTLMGIGIRHPVIAVLLAIFGLIITTILKVFFVGWGVLIGLIIMGGILIYRLTKN